MGHGVLATVQLVVDLGDGDFAGMHNATVAVMRLPPRFQRKAYQGKQCVGGSESLRR
jgi:hypothetical protein